MSWPKAMRSRTQRPAVRRGVTRRKQDYLDALWDGCTNKEIAARLGVTEPTTKRMLRHLGDLAGIPPWDGGLRVRIVRWAIAHGYIGGARVP